MQTADPLKRNSTSFANTFTDLPDTLRDQLALVSPLPSLPSSVLKVINLAQSADSGLHEYASAIEQDPALTLRLLSMANSVFHAPALPTVTCQDAVSRLGLDATLSIALGFGLANTSLPKDDSRLDLTHFWQRSLLAALIAQRLARYHRLPTSGCAFTLGLLQDIGMLALDACVPTLYGELYESSDDHVSLCKRERALWGCDHALIGGWLAAQWQLPARLVKGITSSHANLEEESLLQRCIIASGTMADAWLAPIPALELAVVLPQITHALALDDVTFDQLVVSLQIELPRLSTLMALTQPSGFDARQILFEAKQLLHTHSLRLNKQLTIQQKELQKLRDSHAALDQRVRFDGLTRLYNRPYLEKLLGEHFERARCNAISLAVIFIDLDHFKKLNDEHGHRLGDEVLKAFAELLKEQLDEQILGGRYGGEEFLLFMPGAGNAQALEVAERLSHRLAERPLADTGTRHLYVTASIGIANLDDGDFADVFDLIHAADQGMYLSKRGGRAKISLYQPSVSPASPPKA
nr:GGDEF domain-containing protein [Halomonas populi]